MLGSAVLGIILLIVLNTLLGYLYCRLSKISVASGLGNLFIYNLLGCILCVGCYSFYTIQFRSFYGLGLLFLLILAYVNRKASAPKITFIKSDFVLMAVFLGFAILYTFAFFSNQASSLGVNIHGDDLYYAKLSKYLSLAKEENYFHIKNTMMPDLYRGNVPYHYFDIWLNSFVVSILNLNSYVCLLLVVYTYFKFLMLVGVAALLQHILQIRTGFFIAIASLVLMFWGGLHFNVYEHLKMLNTFCIPMFDMAGNKMNILVLLSLACMLFWIEGNKVNSYLMLAYIPLAFTPTVPAIYGGMMLALLVVLIRYRASLKQIPWFPITIMVVLLGVCMVFIHKPIVTRGIIGFDLSYVFNYYPLWSARTALNIGIGTLINLVLIFMVPILILFYRRKVLKVAMDSYQLLPIGVLIVLILLSGLFSWCLFYLNLDSVQLFYNGVIQLVNVFVLVLLLLVYKHSEKVIKMAVLAYFVIVALFNIQQYFWSVCGVSGKDVFQEEAVKIMDRGQIKGKLGACFLGYKDFESIYSWGQTSSPLDFMFVHDDQYNSVSLGDHYMRLDTKDEMNKIRQQASYRTGLFRRYVDAKRENDVSLRAYQDRHVIYELLFLKEYGISYGLASREYPHHKELISIAKEALYNPKDSSLFVSFDMAKLDAAIQKYR